ncbi:hypothetical protein AZF37_02935 [endosymbiont 'TC1' of Trimyema compressum]|uniref:InlB B-repeat-containing protein n=1 Tax=endosymbiont 'TC1' of Trimyema compressum TaxID=243899 RepID=UPI0007F0AAEA|nr:InlB B-repeat-containing protein [endosymbiont 'TC1' of Trimyema compressum]AMP20266.1 hypothetical protein AZF37_02935 [endosymbiont 'TC1' of Trimyema compressum]
MEFLDSNTVTADITLYAKCTERTYSLEFDLNGAPGIPPATQILTKDSAISPVQNPTWEGYTFEDWNVETRGQGEYWDLNTRTMDPQNTILFAQRSPNHYNVKFDANGGTGTMDNKDYTYGESKPLFENKYTREGYIFKGWSLGKRWCCRFF